MNIAIDGGALCALPSERYGTYFFTKNVIQSLNIYDDLNDYTIYSFCDNSLDISLNPNIRYKKVVPSMSWMKARVPLQEVFSKNDVFLSLNQAIPTTKAKVICFSHGLSFHFYPHLYKEWHSKLESQLKEYLAKSDYIVVSSVRVKDELQSISQFPTNKIIVMPFGIPYDFQEYILEKREPYFLMVGMNHKIKNTEFIVQAFKRFMKYKEHGNYKLYMVGPFQDIQSKSENIIAFPTCTRPQLLDLFRKATAYLSASHYESFNFPILEALSQQCPVISLESATIPELQKYVHLASNEDDMIRYMSSVANDSFAIDSDSLKKDFSWRTYVKDLISLYNR